MEAIVNLLHILGLKIIHYYFLIEIELRPTTLKLSGSHYCRERFLFGFDLKIRSCQVWVIT